LNVAAAAAAAGITFNFRTFGVVKAQIVSMENYACYFLKGYYRSPGAESVPEPRTKEAIVFEDFFTTGLRMLPHHVLVDILHKFWVQLHQLTSNVIVHIDKFIWAVSSCGGGPTAGVFAQHYELHYPQKKVLLEGCQTMLATLFGSITFHPSRHQE
jgi:hypothetical protein